MELESTRLGRLLSETPAPAPLFTFSSLEGEERPVSYKAVLASV